MRKDEEKMTNVTENATPARRLLGFKNWRIAAAVVGSGALAIVAVAALAANSGCDFSIGLTKFGLDCSGKGEP